MNQCLPFTCADVLLRVVGPELKEEKKPLRFEDLPESLRSIKPSKKCPTERQFWSTNDVSISVLSNRISI